MSVHQVLTGGRLAALALMRDQAVVTRAGPPVFDPDTGTYTAATEEVWQGICRVKRWTVATESDAGQREMALRRYLAHLPWNQGADIARDDVLTVTDSDDQSLTGRPLTVMEVIRDGTATARRLVVEDRT